MDAPATGPPEPGLPGPGPPGKELLEPEPPGSAASDAANDWRDPDGVSAPNVVIAMLPPRPCHGPSAADAPPVLLPASLKDSLGDNPERVTFPGSRCMHEPSTASSLARWKGNETPKRACRGPREFASRSSSAVRCRRVERVLRMIRCQRFVSRDADRRRAPPLVCAECPPRADGKDGHVQSSFRAGAAPVVAHRLAPHHRMFEPSLDALPQPAVVDANRWLSIVVGSGGCHSSRSGCTRRHRELSEASALRASAARGIVFAS